MRPRISRRDALRNLALLLGTASAVSTLPLRRSAAAESGPHLLPSDPTAMALAYHESAKAVDAKAFPTFKPNQNCANCLQLQGRPGDAWRPCNLFPGKFVNADGWCRVWTAKT